MNFYSPDFHRALHEQRTREMLEDAAALRVARQLRRRRRDRRRYGWRRVGPTHPSSMTRAA